MWPCAARPASMISAARAVITSVGAKTSVGSRLPCTARSPTSGIASVERRAPVDADHVGAGLAHQRRAGCAVPTPKWIRGTPSVAGRARAPARSAASRERAVVGRA